MSLRPQRRALQRLYAKIPTFACAPGCTDCCGPVPAAAAEIERAPLLPPLAEIASRMASGCLNCPYSKGGNCAVYADRPFMCRLFGTAPDDPMLRCPHGCSPKKPLTPEEADRLGVEYTKIMEAWG